MQVESLNPTAESLEEFRNFPFINDDTKIANLAEELPAYLAAADCVTVTCEEDKVAWWAAHADTLPQLKMLLIQPTSASAERAFSILANAFNAQQDRTLQDYLEACVMLQYNNDKRV